MGIFQSVKNLLKNRRRNQILYRTGIANRKEIRQTAIGWRPDSSYRPDPGNSRIVNGHYDTPSGEEEYYKVVRRD